MKMSTFFALPCSFSIKFSNPNMVIHSRTFGKVIIFFSLFPVALFTGN